jgi:hypothetical protein
MKYEQPGRLNRFVDTDIPPTWSDRWLTFKRDAPILTLCAVIMAEMVLFQSWLREVSNQEILVLLLAGTLGMPLMLFVFAEIEARGADRSKRTLEIREKGLYISPGRHAFIRLEKVLGFLVEPIPADQGIVKVTVVRTSGKNPTPCRWWSIVLDRATQLPALVSELQGTQGWSRTVHELREPLPTRKPVPLRGLWASMLAFYLFFHGVVLIGVGLTPPDGKPSQQKELSEKKVEKLGRFLVKHFHSFEELRRFCLISGGVLTGLSIASAVWSFRLASRSGKETRAHEEQILAAAGVVFDKPPIR